MSDTRIVKIEGSDRYVVPRATINDWNVVNNEDFKKAIEFVFSNVANALKNTLGPYGSTTIIERFGEMHITKDGWQVLKKIYFDDLTNQNLMQLLFNIAAQVVIKVGDGSTSSILSAEAMFKHLNRAEILDTYRPKDFMDSLNKVVGLVTTSISDNSFKISEDGNYEEIYKLALVSTNGDTKVASMIQEIYQKTNNPSIGFKKGRGKDTTLEIIDGYESNITYIDEIFAQNDDGLCTIDNPILLLFDHKIEKEIHFDKIILPTIQEALGSNRRLVVIAPNYDKYLLNYLAGMINSEIKATGTSTVVYCRASLLNNLAHSLYSDFAVMAGATVITEPIVKEMVFENENIEISKFIGGTGKIEIGPKTTLISDFNNINEHMYKLHLAQANNKYKEAEIQYGDTSIVSMDLYELKQRISKLRGKMGTISVGGFSTLEKTALYDLVEDAVKACDSAFNNGYNMGGNLIIVDRVRHILKTNTELTKLDRINLNIIENAFREVFGLVVSNKTKDKDFQDEIFEGSLKNKSTYNLITDKYDNNIINSCMTDIEILKATTSIVSLLVSSNQYLSIKKVLHQ